MAQEFHGVSFDPAAARDAAFRLDELADRLDTQLKDGAPSLAVAAAGTDEVSLHAARTMSEVAASYGDSAGAGVLELRKLAAAFRAQADGLGKVDAASADTIGSASA
ncbi:PE family protein [Nocardia panacis]|uniref:PE family protein n=1 Tax=Nocardia panacis TaxID=2340916 RepID=A0A3A4KGY1_9NOCA|nr:PE family protein [Nocardia panacis]RJO72100.1 PE family protein [Nocardia panacis]